LLLLSEACKKNRVEFNVVRVVEILVLKNK
jgi:hypothetical protein